MLIDQTERSDEMVTERQQDILNLIIDILPKRTNLSDPKPCKSLLTLAAQPFVMTWRL